MGMMRVEAHAVQPASTGLVSRSCACGGGGTSCQCDHKTMERSRPELLTTPASAGRAPEASSEGAPHLGHSFGDVRVLAGGAVRAAGQPSPPESSPLTDA